MATKYFISSHIWKLMMQFGLCISQVCYYVLCPLRKNIVQTAKNAIDDVTQKVNATGVT